MKPVFKLLLSLVAGFQSLELHAQETSNHWKRLPDLPDKIGVAGAFAGVSGGALIVAGGANFPDAPPWEGGKKVFYDTIWALEKLDGEWREVGRLPRPCAYGSSLTIRPDQYGVDVEKALKRKDSWTKVDRDGVLCIGGADATSHYADVFLLSYTNGTVSFSNWPSLPKSTAYSAATFRMGDVFVGGGVEYPTSTTAISTYWLAMAIHPTNWLIKTDRDDMARQLAIAGTTTGAIYLIGGTKLLAGPEGKPVRTYLSDAYIEQPCLPWKRITDLPFPLAASPSPAATVNGKLVIFGGDDAPSADPKTHKGFRDEMLEYDPATDKWTIIGHMPAPRATAPVVFWNGGYVIVSGEVRRGVRSREAWMWTP